MGLIDWINRKKEETRVKNQALSDARRHYYRSDAYKQIVAQVEEKKLREGKNNEFSSWLKRVSKNAASQFNDETAKIDMDKIMGRENEKRK